MKFRWRTKTLTPSWRLRVISSNRWRGSSLGWLRWLRAGNRPRIERLHRIMNPTTSANEHRQQLQAYGTPLVEYYGHGTVRWKNGTSKDLAFEAGQFPSGKI